MNTQQQLLVAMLLAASSTVTFAQPNPYGCHYFRNAPGPIHYQGQGRAEIDETIARSDTFDILSYDITLDLTNYASDAFVAATSINFAALMSDQDHIRFDLFELVVDSVVGSTGPLTFSYDEQFLDVTISPAPIGEEQVITVHYHGAPHRDPDWGGFYFEGGYMYNLGIGLSTIPPNFGKVWYPCFDSFVERASYTYHVKSAGTFRLHGQGEFLGEVQLGGDTVIRSFHLPQSIPTHLSAVAVADYQNHEYDHSGLNAVIPVRLSAKPAALPNMVARFVDLPDAIDACEYWYGPYGYDRVGYVLTTDGALEIPTNVAYPEFMTGQPLLDNRDLLSHELGHHWWGNIVTPFVHNDMWLKEGPAEYTGHLVAEWQNGQTGLVNAVKDNQFYVLRTAHINDDGFQALSPMPDPHIYGTHTYYKGAAVMHNLRGYMGDEAFRSAMRGIQQDLANTTITAVGFKEALESQSGQDLDPFFDAWVFAPGYSVFEVKEQEVVQNGDAFTVTLDIAQRLRGATVFHQEVPLDITFISATGEVHDQEVTVGGELSTFELQVPFAPTVVALNRYARLNQARMDHEVQLIPGQPIENLLPFTDFRLYPLNVPDTALFRVDHIWAAPDQEPLNADIYEISNSHYWNVDGNWPEGLDLDARLYYYGPTEGQLDFDLVGQDETGIALLYRRSPLDSWEVYPDQVISAGNLTSGTGFISFSNLRKGQYTFGKFAGSIGIGEPAEEAFNIQLSPVPTSNMLNVSGTFDGSGTVWLDIHGVDGRFHGRTVVRTTGSVREGIDTSQLAAGSYILKIQDSRGMAGTEQMFEVVR